ncbi:response regulator transcription factor [Marixanthomonas ophiurae]|uniref:LuxR family transcriptional regulator n=1 Tax=Marixanthomonas ophiurae TaxID=387659 RepID=A0A3E1Q8J4_9FLAO|nr:helix-turn-helix transcriptional regulator [Marixanthomonas ophiurae]RFN58451.1 LuxR family transcriptional regulator [Marixanthomonas ophiurae]
MEILTEKEQLLQSQHFAFRLRNLYQNDRQLFDQLNDYIPYSIHINRQDNLDITYANDKPLFKAPEMEKLVEVGSSYLDEISCLVLHRNAVTKATKFRKANDIDSVCSYIQQLQFNNEKRYFYSNKLILDNDLYFNISSTVDELGLIGKVFNSIFRPIHTNQISWQQFQSLTKQEKKILHLLANGSSTKEIAEQLFISTHTAQTHRRNINQKLNISSVSDLVKISLILEII